MYEAEHVVKLADIARDLQRELAHAYDPNRSRIVQLCQEAENHILAVYRWANAIHEDE